MKNSITTAKELRTIADAALARKNEIKRIDTLMCYETVIEPELQSSARDGNHFGIVSIADIKNYNPNRRDEMLDEILELLKANNFGYETCNGNLKIVF